VGIEGGMKTNFCGDGYGWDESSVLMQLKLDGDGYKICGDEWELV